MRSRGRNSYTSWVQILGSPVAATQNTAGPRRRPQLCSAPPPRRTAHRLGRRDRRGIAGTQVSPRSIQELARWLQEEPAARFSKREVAETGSPAPHPAHGGVAATTGTRFRAPPRPAPPLPRLTGLSSTDLLGSFLVFGFVSGLQFLLYRL